MVKFKNCVWCNTPFQQKANSQKYCSPQCAKQAHLDANAHLRPVPQRHKCPHNANLMCERRTCSRCGWNPEVEKRRRAKILANMEKSNGTN